MVFDPTAVQPRSTSTRLAASPRVLILALFIVIVACSERARAPVSAHASMTVSASGLRAYRDPVTGAFAEPPASAPSLAPRRVTAGAQAAGLTETSAAGGGTMVHLNGGFRSQVRARAGAQGPDIICVSAAAWR